MRGDLPCSCQEVQTFQEGTVCGRPYLPSFVVMVSHGAGLSNLHSVLVVPGRLVGRTSRVTIGFPDTNGLAGHALFLYLAIAPLVSFVVSRYQ